MKEVASAFRKIHRQLKPRGPLPRIKAEFFPSVGANHSAVLHKGILTVRVSDLFVDAPIEIFEALAAILLCKLYRKKIDPRHQKDYRRYTMSRDMVERSRKVRAARGRPSPTTGPRGRTRNLEAIFNRLNARYFDGRLRKPELSWTFKIARSVLGRYDFDQDVIFISRFLDSANVPDFVVDYIVFHEMLHVKHGCEVDDDREIVHTAGFRREEKQFRYYAAANEWLNRH